MLIIEVATCLILVIYVFLKIGINNNLAEKSTTGVLQAISNQEKDF